MASNHIAKTMANAKRRVLNQDTVVFNEINHVNKDGKVKNEI